MLALLPLLGHPLQAKYHGPYVVERKVGALDYVIATPDHQKQRQLCHVNMLKEYNEQDHDKMKTYAVVVTSDHCKQEVEEFEVEPESLSDNGVRFNNSAILANLRNKLDHLPVKEAY